MSLLRFILIAFCFLYFGNAEKTYAQTSLLPGDLVVLGANANDNDCSASSGSDIISFACFKTIEVGTLIDVIDNGWELQSPNLFGNKEGFLRMTFNQAIPQGEVVTIFCENFTGALAYTSISHPGAISFALTGNNMNLKNDGDQLFFGQGGEWFQGSGIDTHDATYSGSILFGYNTLNTWAANGETSGSNLHPEVDPCFHVESSTPGNGDARFNKYTGPMSPATQLEWINRVKDLSNWTEFPDCATYNSTAPLWEIPLTLPITPSDIFVECDACSGCGTFNDVLTFNLPSSGGPFNVTYQNSNGGTFMANNVFDGHTENITVTGAVTYSIFSITDSQGCPIYSNFTDEAVITVGTGPVFDNPGTLSNCGSVTFPSITGVDLSGDEMYFSEPNGLGTSYNPFQQTTVGGTYYIYDPNSACDSQESFTVNITPSPDLFLLQPTPVVCAGESFNISTINVIDNSGLGATVTYHTATPANAGNQILGNYQPTNGEMIFAYAQEAPNCDDTLPLTLTTSTAPTATISGGGSACPGESFDLTIDFTGTAPWDFQYSEEGTPVLPIITTSDNPYTLTVNPSSNTSYELVSVEDASCEGTVFGSSMVTTSTINATLSGATTICAGENTDITVTFDAGDAPYSFIIRRNGAFFQNISSPTSSIVINSGSLFFDTEFTIINAQADGCGAIEGAGVTVSINDAPEATISGDQTICEGGQATISIEFDGDANHTFEYAANSVGQGSMTSSLSPFTFDVNPTADVTYTLISYEDDTGCAGDLVGQAVIDVTPAPTATLSAGGSVCAGASYDLMITFTGEGPFTFVHTEGGVPQLPGLTTSDNPFTLSVNPSSTTNYGLSSVASGTCDGSVNGTATVTVTDALSTTNADVTCNQVTQEYVVSFEINGGTAPYTVSGNAGTVVGNLFVSDPIPSGAYSFTVDDDSNCPPIVVAGAQDCTCTNNAGTMDFPPATVIACQSELISLTHNGDETVDAGDVFGYIIHESPNPEATLPLQWNPTSATFDFTGFLTLNTVYYVSAVTAAPEPLVGFDLNDPCLSVSAGVPVMFVADPTGMVTATAAVCEGDDATLTFDFTGTAPFTYTYNIDGAMPSIVQQTNNTQVVTTIPITQNTVVTLESIEDNICAIDINQSVNIDFNENITAVATDTICTADITSYQIEVEVTGVEPFSVVGTGGTFVGTTFTSDAITSGDPYSFEITDANACNTITISGLYVCEYACTGELGDMSTTGLDLCVGDVASATYDNTNENIEAGDLRQYVIHANPDASLGTPILIQNSTDFAWNAMLYNPNTVYYISAISGDDDGTGNVDLVDPCLLVNEGQLVAWNQGSASFTTTDTNICGGANVCIDLIIEAVGIPNFAVVVSDGMGGVETVSDFNTTMTYQVCPDVETTYTITSMTSNGCDGLVGMPSSVTISPQANFAFENLQYDCTPDNTQYAAAIDLIGGTQPYTLVSGGGTLMGSNYVSDLIASNTPVTVEFMDALGCTLSVNLQNNCDCMNAPAIVNTDIQELCLGEFSEIIILTQTVWGPGDVSAFFLHDGTASELGGTIYNITNDIFNQEPAGYTPGDTLFFTPVVSEADANDLPDLDDSCLNIGVGFPVVWYASPELNVPEDISSCTDDCQDFTYTFFQEGEHTLDLTINSSLQSFPSVNGQVVVTICPVDYGVETGGTVELIPVSLTNAGGCITNYNNSPITQLVIIAPEMTDLTEQICMNDSIVVGTTVFNLANPTGQVTLQNQANCDSIVDVILTFYNIPEGDFMPTICQGDDIEFEGIIFDAMNPTGQVTLPDASYLGCDSIVNVTLSFSNNPEGDFFPTVCQGDDIEIEGVIFDAMNPTGQVTLPDASFFGCDSIVNVSLSFYDVPEGDLMVTLCEGGNIEIEGVIFDEMNTMGQVTLADASYLGCDSLLNVSVDFSTSVSFQLDTFICAGNSATINGEIYDATNTTGSFTFDDGSYLGCDSIVNVSLFFYDPANANVSFDLCEGGSVEVGGIVFDETNPSGPAILIGGSFNGCDSTVNVSTNFFTEIIFDLNGTYCSDTSFTVGAEVFDIDNQDGMVTFPMGSYLGCDSTVVVDLEFYPDVETNINMTLCTGDTFEVGGIFFDEATPAGTVTLDNATFNGCDSTVNVSLMFNDIIMANLDTTLCEGESFTINTTTYDADNLMGTENFPMGSYLGCDSVLNVMVTMAQPAIENYNNELCEGEILDIEGTIYDVNTPMGTQILSIPSFAGCDSIAEINLSFLTNAEGVMDTTLCAGETAIIGGVLFDETNTSSTFTFGGMAFNGCDSILTINVTFTPASTETLNIFLGIDETFVLEGQVFDENNLFGVVTIENGSYTGCDSIITVNVTNLLDVGGIGLPPTCFGDANGSIRVDTILYGTPPYTVTVDGNLFGSFSNFPYLITGLEAGEYDVNFTDAGGSFIDSEILVPSATELTLDLGDNEEIRQGETYTIEALTNMDMTNVADLIWTPTDSLDNDTTLTVTSSILESTTYNLFLRDSMGCSVSESVTIFVNEERFVFIPTAFSPNDDGFNDTFTIFASEQVVQIKSLSIFDRWGNQIFYNFDFLPNDVTLGWNGIFDGQEMNSQTFVYVAEIEYIDGKTEVMRGDFILVR